MGRSSLVLLVVDLFHPISRLAVKLLHYGDMSHGSGWHSAMPVLLTWRKPNHITRSDFLDRSTPTLCPAATGCHHQGLSQRMGVPSCTRGGLEGNARPQNTRWRGRIEERVNAHRTGKILCRSLAGRLRTASFDFPFGVSLLIPWFERSATGQVLTALQLIVHYSGATSFRHFKAFRVRG